MRTIGFAAFLVVTGLTLTARAAPEAPAPADFKVNVSFYGVKKEPIRTAVLLVRRGKVFELLFESEEVTVLDFPNDRVAVFNLRRMVYTEMSTKKLDDGVTKLHKAIESAIKKKQEAGGRANEVAAQMSRELIDPRFRQTFDPAAGHLRLTNPSVELDVKGEPEPDVQRRKLIFDAITTLIKFGAVRDPSAIPPFPRLEALRVLAEVHHLRPVEVVVLYRLAGPPRKYRWTYQFEPTLTERETAALAKLNALLERAKFVRFDHYEQKD